MLRRLPVVAPVAALLAIGTPQPSAEAMGVPLLQSDAALVLVGGRGGERGDRDDGRRFRRGDDDGRRFRRGDDDGRRFRRDDDREAREFRRHRRRDNRDYWFGFGPSFRYDDCEWLRHRARDTGSSYWWRRYRACARGR